MAELRYELNAIVLDEFSDLINLIDKKNQLKKIVYN